MQNIKNSLNETESRQKRELLAYLIEDEGIEILPDQTILPRKSFDELPLSFAQARLWFFEQLEPNNPFYNIAAAVRLVGQLDAIALQQSLQEIVQRHEILRTSFLTKAGKPFQVIAPTLTLTLPVVDWQDLSESEREAETLQLATVEARQPFNLEQGPLIRATLLRLGEEEHVLLLTMHHIVSDGWSMGVLIKEIAALYPAFLTSKTSSNFGSLPLPELSIQYADFALWQQQLEGKLKAQLDYWQQQLAEAPPILELPTDRPRPAVQTYRGARRSLHIPKTLTEELRARSQQEGATIFMTLLAAFKTLLYRYTGQSDILVGSPIANRNQVQTEPLIGYFANTLVLRTKVSGNSSFQELLRQVKKQCLEAYAHQDLPFNHLVEALQPKRSLSHHPLFQVAFVLQNAPMPALELPGLTLTVLEVDNKVSQFDLTLNLQEQPEGLSGWIEYNTDLFDPETICRMAGHFQTLLKGIVTKPQQQLDCLPLLSKVERRQLLVEWNGDGAISEAGEAAGAEVAQASCLREAAGAEVAQASCLREAAGAEVAQASCLREAISEAGGVNTTIHHLFEAAVERTPDAVAVVFEDTHLTYQELNKRANQIAHYLQQLGIKPDSLVGICMERSLEMVVGLLGILKAGAAYLPIDPRLPQERIGFMLADAAVSVLLVQQDLASKLHEHKAQVVCIDTDAGISQQSELNPDSGVTAENLAYVIYTSGSTGKPKGVLVSHSNVVRLFASTQSWFHFDECDVWTNFHSYAFDFSVWEIWGAILHGGRLVIVPHWISRSPDAFYELLSREQVTILNQTPSAFRQLIQAEQTIYPALAHTLRFVIFGGEALELQSLKSWFERHGDRCPQLVNMYGITETTVHSTYRPISATDLSKAWSSPIGTRIPDLQIYILDQNLQPVPVGVPGEIYVGGAGVALGYLNRPDLTAERFVPNPIENSPSNRLYKSGDLARYLANGEIEYLGRIDHQVKIRGFRIELGEISAALCQHPLVREAIALVREDESSKEYGSNQEPTDAISELRCFLKGKSTEVNAASKRLVAYCVYHQQLIPTTTELCNFLKDKLPEHAIPSAFVKLDALPLTTNGKVDLRSLPAPSEMRPDLKVAFIAPNTPKEKLLAAIWTQVLGLEQVGIHDNFFELGGDSIRGIQVRAKAQEIGLNFSLQQLFQYQTISELAQKITIAEPNVLTQKIGAFDLISDADLQKLPSGVEDAYPLARIQAGVIFHCQCHPGVPMYHDIFFYHLRVRLEVQLLQKALQQLVDRHAMLRTSFDLTNFSEPLQLVHKTISMPLQVEDWRSLSPSQQAEVQKVWIEKEKSRYFDWKSPPLIRFYVHRLEDESFNLVVSFHDSILDGWSTSSLMTELLHCYCALLNGENSHRESPSVKYRDFVALERRNIESEECQQFWKQNLSDCVVSMLPRLSPSLNPTHTPQIAILDVPISLELSDQLKKLAALAGVPLKHVLLAAHLKVMSLLSSYTDVLTGLESNGRLEEADGEQTIGMHLNTVPFRLNLSDGTWIDLIRETFTAELNLLPFRRYPLADLQKDRRGQPLVETVFNYTHFHVFESVQRLKGLEVLSARGFEETHFTLRAEFNLNAFSSCVQLDLAANLAQISREQLEAIGRYYAQTLVSMANEPFKRHEFQCLLSSQELQLLTWSDTAREYPQLCIHQLFEAQVEKKPEAIAIVFNNQFLTYQALNQRANQVAHYLRQIGVGPETLVGICVERSLEMVIGLLGILKAGGAYVPLDPEYPKERLAFMLADSQLPVLLTTTQLLPLPETNAQLVCLDSDWQIAQARADNPISGVTSDNLAYVIYTSGSTGQPKGVQIEHRAANNLLHSMSDRPGLTEQDVLLAVTSLSFDIAALEIFLPLMMGAKLVMASQAVAADGKKLIAEVSRSGASAMQATPSRWSLLLEAGWQGNKQLKMLCGGEALKKALAKQLLEKGASLWNLYGPTETTIWSAVYEVASEDEFISIGGAIANTQIYLLDAYLQPVPIGVPGDLYIGGDGLARGYLNRPDLTALKFIPNPFESKSNRLYKTGDLARYLPNGKIEFLGRTDHQVKIRGFRIELGEIETLLAQHQSVREAVVIERQDIPGEQRLVAYVVPNLEALTISELRSFLQQKLPDYMMPSLFMLLEALPLTPNGKVDRRAIPMPDRARPELQDFVAPRNTLERKIAQIWEDIFNLRPIGITDNFFNLGGHSLLAVRLMARIKEQFGQEISLSTFFQLATIEYLANSLRQQTDSLIQSSLVAIQPHGSKRPFFCIHPIGGSVFCYVDLARCLGLEQPFYGLQAPGIDGEQQPYTRIEDMATHYIELMRSQQPIGPYQLGGWSFGGIVAFEMAQQLQTQGEQVSLLALMDSRMPSLSEKYTEHASTHFFLDLLSLLNVHTIHDDFCHLSLNEQLNYVLEQARKTNFLPADAGLMQIQRLMQVYRSNMQALQSYRPKVYPHRISVLSATEATQPDSTISWKNLTSEGVEIHLVPGDHYSFIKTPHVEFLAAQLKTFLDRTN